MPNRHLEPPQVADALVTKVTPVKPKAPQPTQNAPQPTQNAPQPTQDAPQPSTSEEKPAAQAVPNTIVLDGKRFSLVQFESPKKPALPALPKSPNEVIDEVLATPAEKPNVNRRSGPRLAILPRCISSQAYRDIILAKEEARRRMDEEKENRRREREEAKAKKAAEKEAKAKKGKGKGIGKSSAKKGNAVQTRVPSQRKVTKKVQEEVWSSSSEDESAWSSSSSEDFYEGSTSRCSECDV